MKRIEWRDAEITRLRGNCHALQQALKEEVRCVRLLAKLSATVPMFFNPLEAIEAVRIRDQVLASMKPERSRRP